MLASTGSGLRRLHGVERVFAVAAFPLAVAATVAWTLLLIRGGIEAVGRVSPAFAVHT